MEIQILAMQKLPLCCVHTGAYYKRLCIRCSEKGERVGWGQAFEKKQKQKSSQQPDGGDRLFLSHSLSLASCPGLKWESRTNSYGLIISVDRESVKGTLLKVDPYLLERACWARQGG